MIRKKKSYYLTFGHKKSSRHQHDHFVISNVFKTFSSLLLLYEKLSISNTNKSIWILKTRDFFQYFGINFKLLISGCFPEWSICRYVHRIVFHVKISRRYWQTFPQSFPWNIWRISLAFDIYEIDFIHFPLLSLDEKLFRFKIVIACHSTAGKLCFCFYFELDFVRSNDSELS